MTCVVGLFYACKNNVKQTQNVPLTQPVCVRSYLYLPGHMDEEHSTILVEFHLYSYWLLAAQVKVRTVYCLVA